MKCYYCNREITYSWRVIEQADGYGHVVFMGYPVRLPSKPLCDFCALGQLERIRMLRILSHRKECSMCFQMEKGLWHKLSRSLEDQKISELL